MEKRNTRFLNSFFSGHFELDLSGVDGKNNLGLSEAEQRKIQEERALRKSMSIRQIVKSPYYFLNLRKAILTKTFLPIPKEEDIMVNIVSLFQHLQKNHAEFYQSIIFTIEQSIGMLYTNVIFATYITVLFMTYFIM